MHVLRKGGIEAMPHDTDELYATAPLPSRLKWAGLDTAMRTMAVLAIRKHRKQI